MDHIRDTRSLFVVPFPDLRRIDVAEKEYASYYIVQCNFIVCLNTKKLPSGSSVT